MVQIYEGPIDLEKPLRLTGHPFVDVGVDTLAAIIGQVNREDVTQAQLRQAAEQIKTWYTRHEAVRRYLTVIFTNSGFVQSSFSEEQRQAYANEWLFAFEEDRLAEIGEERCTFFPELAAVRRAYRQHIPLLNGEEIGNFFGRGRHGLSVSGLALLAIHAMPLGCLPCGKLLLFHQLGMPHEPQTTRLNADLAFANYTDLSRLISGINFSDKSVKLTDYSKHARTRFVERIVEVRREIRQEEALLPEDASPLPALLNVTGYYFTNYGPSPDVEIIRLDNTVLDFIEEARVHERRAWNAIVYSAWERRRGDSDDIPANERRVRRNFFYERLLELPHHPLRVLYFLARGGSWRLIEIFLERVMLMERERIETYRRLGDKLADYAVRHTNQPHSFYHRFKRARSYADLRSVIRDASEKMYKAHMEDPLFTYDEFILAFEPPREVYSQWKLARDLIAIRMLERLHQHNVDLSDLPEDEESDLDEE